MDNSIDTLQDLVKMIAMAKQPEKCEYMSKSVIIRRFLRKLVGYFVCLRVASTYGRCQVP